MTLSRGSKGGAKEEGVEAGGCQKSISGLLSGEAFGAQRMLLGVHSRAPEAYQERSGALGGDFLRAPGHLSECSAGHTKYTKTTSVVLGGHLWCTVGT